MSAMLRASLAAEGFGTESGPTTAAATAEERKRKTQRALEEAALDAAVAINQVHGFFGGCPCGEQGRYGRSVRPTRLLCRGWPSKAQRCAERCLRGLATLFSTQARQSTASLASVQTWTPCKRASLE